MALTNSQYDALMRTYNDKQFRNQFLTEQRKEEVYHSLPQLKSIDDQIASVSVASVRSQLTGDVTRAEALKNDLHRLLQQKEQLLTDGGYALDYLEPDYSCPDCHDTGYINGKRCHCFKQAAINMVYTQSNIADILQKENFSTFSYEYYSSKVTDSVTGRTSLENAQRAVADAKSFVHNFGEKGGNLFLYGDTGTGKTFLSNCIAKALLDESYSVIYFTAFQLFDIFEKNVFDKNEDALEANENIFNCDLLIIDDLGTEFANSFTTSQLFQCLNERLLRGRSTIVSTNLSLKQIAEIYSERTFSRITSNYKLIKLFGDDIRIAKKFKNNK